MPFTGPIFVIHSPALVERRAALGVALEALGWRADWVDRPEPRELGLGLLRHRPNPRLNRHELSVYLKHREVFRRIAHGDAPRALVLEDDAVLPDRETVARYIAAIPGDADLVFLGASCGMEVEAQAAHPLFGFGPRTRSLSGVVITRACAAAIDTALGASAMSKPIDLAVDDIIRARSLRVYWSVPSLIENGSETGRFARSIIDGGWRRHPLVGALRKWSRIVRSIARLGQVVAGL